MEENGILLPDAYPHKKENIQTQYTVYKNTASHDISIISTILNDIQDVIKLYAKKKTVVWQLSQKIHFGRLKKRKHLQEKIMALQVATLTYKVLPFVDAIVYLLSVHAHRPDLIEMLVDDMQRNIDHIDSAYQRNVMRVDDALYFYLQAGDPQHATKIVHLHGLVWSRNNFLWQITDPQMQENAFHIAPNMYAHIYDLSFTEYSLAYMNQYINALLAHIDGPVHLHGVSFGGQIAYNYAIHNPDKTKSLILSGASWLQKEDVGEGRALIRQLKNKDFVTEKVEKQFYDTTKVPVDLVDEVYDFINNKDNLSWPLSFRKKSTDANIEENIDILEQIREKNIPVKLIWGEYDEITPLAVITRFTQALHLDPRQIYTFPTGHTPNIESPELYNQQLLSRIETIQGPHSAEKNDA